MKRLKRLSCIMLTTLLFFAAALASAATYNFVVDNPHYPEGSGPVIAVDEGHNNFHNLQGRFEAFGELAEADGFTVQPISGAFTRESLAEVDILVTATALDAVNVAIEDPDNNGWVLAFNPLAPPDFMKGLYPQSAYTDDEIAIIKEWVKDGGSLMLVTDHMPFPAAAQALAKAFGVILNNAYAFDGNFLLFAASQGQVGGNSSNLLKFYADQEGAADSNGTLYTHPITNGLDYVTSFTGSAFRVLPGVNYQPIMELGEDTLMHYPWNHVAYEKSPLNEVSLPLGKGLLQGITMTFGEGNLAVFAEAAMFSAREFDPNGVTHPEAPFNQDFTLNTLSWLADKSSGENCIALGADISFTVPNMNLSGLKFGVNFIHKGELDFQMDMASLIDADATFEELSFSQDNSLIIPCIDVFGTHLQITLTSPTHNFKEWTITSYVEK